MHHATIIYKLDHAAKAKLIVNFKLKLKLYCFVIDKLLMLPLPLILFHPY